MGTASAIAGSGNASLLFTSTTNGSWYIDVDSANGVVGTYDVVAIDTGIRLISSVATLVAGTDDFIVPDATGTPSSPVAWRGATTSRWAAWFLIKQGSR